MNRIIKFKRFFCLVLLITALLLFTGCAAGPKETLPESGRDENNEPVYEQVILKGRPFNLELALTSGQREKGLMGRDTIAADEGMLFVYPDEEPYPAKLNFWMKDCLIPIDLIFIDREGIITAVHEMKPPQPGTADEDLVVYSSKRPAQFAIEIKGGLAAELGLLVGDTIKLDRDNLVKKAR